MERAIALLRHHGYFVIKAPPGGDTDGWTLDQQFIWWHWDGRHFDPSEEES